MRPFLIPSPEFANLPISDLLSPLMSLVQSASIADTVLSNMDRKVDPCFDFYNYSCTFSDTSSSFRLAVFMYLVKDTQLLISAEDTVSNIFYLYLPNLSDH